MGWFSKSLCRIGSARVACFLLLCLWWEWSSNRCLFWGLWGTQNTVFARTLKTDIWAETTLGTEELLNFGRHGLKKLRSTELRMALNLWSSCLSLQLLGCRACTTTPSVRAARDQIQGLRLGGWALWATPPLIPTSVSDRGQTPQTSDQILSLELFEEPKC